MQVSPVNPRHEGVSHSTSGSGLVDLAAFDRARLMAEPYPTVTVPGFVLPDALRSINRDYPSIEGPTSRDVHQIAAGPAFRDLVGYLESDDFCQRVSDKFKMDLAANSRMTTVRKYAEWSDGQIHTESKTKVVTVLIYFNEYWAAPGGRLRVLRSPTDMEDYAAEIVPTNGTLFAFRRCDWSWHGFPPCSGERRSLQMHYVAPKRAQRGYLPKGSIRKRLRSFIKHVLAN